MKTDKSKWANIICDANHKPQTLIVTDGNHTVTIPITNSRLSLVKKLCRELYDVPAKQILVSVILGDANDRQSPT